MITGPNHSKFQSPKKKKKITPFPLPLFTRKRNILPGGIEPSFPLSKKSLVNKINPSPKCTETKVSLKNLLPIPIVPGHQHRFHLDQLGSGRDGVI